MNLILWIALSAVAALFIAWLVSHLVKSSDDAVLLNEYASGLPIDLAAAIHDRTLLHLQTEATMPPPTNLKTIERLTEVAASLRYVVGSKSEAVFTIQDKGRYRTALALAVVRSLRADRTNEAKWLLGIGREFDPFRLPESVVRGGYSDADLDEHVEELAARIK